MNNLTDVYNQIAEADVTMLEKQAAHIKVAEEEDAAGRIMARGFADELTKIAGGGDMGYGSSDGTSKQKLPTPPKVNTDIVKAKPKTGTGTGPAAGPQLKKRPTFGGPSMPAEPKKVHFKRNKPREY